MDIIENNSNYPWALHMVGHNPNVTWEYFKEHFDQVNGHYTSYHNDLFCEIGILKD